MSELCVYISLVSIIITLVCLSIKAVGSGKAVAMQVINTLQYSTVLYHHTRKLELKPLWSKGYGVNSIIYFILNFRYVGHLLEGTF